MWLFIRRMSAVRGRTERMRLKMKDVDKDTGETVAIHSGGIIGVDHDEPSSCSSQSAGSASGLTQCAGCKTPLLGTLLYYVGGENEDEPLCGACMCDALLSLRMKMQNAEHDISEERG